MRKALFERVLAAEMGLFGRQSASALSNTVVYEVQNGSNLLVQALLGLSRDGFTLIALLGYLLYLNWQLTLIVAVVVPGVAWIMKTLSRRLYKLTKFSQQATDELAYVVEENVLAHRMVRPHGAQQSQASRFGALSQSLRRLAIKSTIASRRHDAADPIVGRRSLVGGDLHRPVAKPWGGGLKDVTVGGFVSFITAMLMLIAPSAGWRMWLTPSRVALLRWNAVYRYWVTPGQSRKARTLPTGCGEIVLNQVSVSFGAEQAPALNNVSLRVAPGEIVALVGPSGAGKTTLVNLLPRFVNSSQGQITLDGHELRHLEPGLLRSQFAMVSQDVVMFNDTIAANVALGSAMDENRCTNVWRQPIWPSTLRRYRRAFIPWQATMQRNCLGATATFGHCPCAV